MSVLMIEDLHFVKKAKENVPQKLSIFKRFSSGAALISNCLLVESDHISYIIFQEVIIFIFKSVIGFNYIIISRRQW